VHDVRVFTVDNLFNFTVTWRHFLSFLVPKNTFQSASENLCIFVIPTADIFRKEYCRNITLMAVVFILHVMESVKDFNYFNVYY
jgi:hypothetical protein